MEQIVKLTNQTQNGGILAEGNTVNASKDCEKTVAPISERNGPSRETRSITSELLDVFLYGKRKIQEINLEEAKRQKTAKDLYEKNHEKDRKTCTIWCENCRTRHTGPCLVREPLQTMHQLVGKTVHDIKLTYAVLSFPDEVQLCTSSIPGYIYGVSAKQPFPIGTWIGPYEGKRIKSEEITIKTDTNYVWEIYEEGKFSHYLDGNDEENSSWMRFIRCARHKGEQNMVVFQYGNNIYYRAVRDISVGTELLVWYNNNYSQFLGVPLGLRNVPGSKKGLENTNPAQPPLSKAQTSPVPQTDVKPVLMEQSNGNNNQKVGYSRTPESYGKAPEGNSKAPDFYSKPPDVYSKPPGGYSRAPDVYSKPPAGSKPPDVYSKPPEGNSKAPGGNSKPPGGYSKPPGGYSKPPGGYSKTHETVYSSRQMQTSTTYCYSASQPTGLPTSYTLPSTNNLKMVQPTVTIEHRPTVSEFTSSRNHTTSPGNAPRQPYVTPYSGSSPVLTSDNNNNNYFVFCSNESPPAGSTSSVSIFHNDLPQNTPSEEANIWKCGQCLQTFNQRLLLQLHVCVPPSGKPYQCGHCSDSFSQPAELRSHVVTHSTDRPFKCGFCGRAFAGAATLNNHMRTHTGERPFLCQNCGRTFGIATQLSRHMRTPGECPMGANQPRSEGANEFRSDASPPPFTSTLTRG